MCLHYFPLLPNNLPKITLYPLKKNNQPLKLLYKAVLRRTNTEVDCYTIVLN